MSMTEKDYRIPVTILTGFLGSGKTTTLNNIIRENTGKKLAVIENEFGEINIDSNLIVGVDDNNVFEMSNGCVCCSLNDELVDTLQMLLKKTGAIDHLIVETTGIADPGPVALNFISDYKIQNTFRLDAIVSVVDAQFIKQQLEVTDIAGKQIAHADIVILNKTDKIDKSHISELHKLILTINPHAEIIESSFGKIESRNLIDINGFSMDDKFITQFERNRSTPVKFSLSQEKPLSGYSFKDTVKPKNSLNHIDVASHSFEFIEPMDLVKFDLWMSVILNLNSKNIYRVKGILNFFGVQDKVVFQSVHNQFLSASGGRWAPEEKRKSRLVIIGKNLIKEELESGLHQCLYDSKFEGVEIL